MTSAPDAAPTQAAWFDEARFGMFVHWSASSQQGVELSWPMVGGIPALPYGTPMAVDDYYRGALDFDPKPDSPRAFVAAAKAAGMGYAVLTTKHHDGFSMFPSAFSDFSIAQAAYGRDIVREYVDALRAEDMRVGFYYSLSDWHQPDYPAYGADESSYLAYLGKRSEPEAWARYVDIMFGQVRELLTNYGQIDVLWFDGQWERTADEWKATELEQMIRELQPGILINDRLPGGGDITTPEQGVPDDVPTGRWETCMTMNRTWGYCPADHEYKSAHDLVHTLCEIAGKGGNLLLNVSPTGTGELPPEQLERLEVVGRWMRDHGESIRGTTAGLEAWQFYGPSTRKGNRLFLHLPWRPYDSFRVRGIRLNAVQSVKHLATGEALEWTKRATAQQEMFGRDPVGDLVISVPEWLLDPVATVVEVTLAD
ncbi:MAG: alpha-L-fucosidase [Actinobacteria bacterium]|nr:alpha-L-fucosidase [Actinomycetota bacterium]MBV8959593.1 alpha-L-fucosidase [Actinomycetota bacterium]MBV9252774.1 alpha-L-fucosidase [Actinomycetota bacterium]